MGVSAKILSRLVGFSQYGLLKPGGSVIELGAQELYCQGAEQAVADFINHFSNAKPPLDPSDEFVKALSNRGFASQMYKRAGFQYKALDIFDGDEVLLFDLNLDVPGKELSGQFDLVTNIGTTEHVINQFNSFKTIHELARPGGLIYHDLPMGGFHTHGYFNYNPLLFQHLANANGYEVVFQWYSQGGAPTDAPEFMRNAGFGNQWTDRGIEFVFRKVSAEPFRMPLETGTSLSLNPEVWGGEDPYGRGAAMPEPAGAGSRRPADMVEQVRRSNLSMRLRDVSGWDLQRELISRYRAQFMRLLRR